MARKALIEVLGDARSLLATLKHSATALRQSSTDFERLGVSAKKSAEAQVAGSVRTQARLKEQVVAYRQIASSAKRGSAEQVAASRLASRAEEKVAKALATSTREQIRFTASSRRATSVLKGEEATVGRFSRGALAGSGAVSHLGRSLAFASSTFIGAAGFVAAAKAAVGQAEGLDAQIERTNAVFVSSAHGVQTWSTTSAHAFGLSRQAALEATDTLGTLLENIGQAPLKAAAMSEQFVRLAVDMAAFKKVKPEVALSALEAALTGRTRSLKQFGIVVDATAIKAEALSSGIVKSSVDVGRVRDAQQRVAIARANLGKATADHGANSVQAASATVAVHSAQRQLAKETAGATTALSAQQKALATYNLILKQTRIQQGAFGRSQGQLAIKEQVFRAGLANTEAVIGGALLPTVSKYVGRLGQWLSKSKNQATLTRDVAAASRALAGAIAAASAVIVPLVKAADRFAKSIGGWKTTLELAAGAFVGFKAVGVATAFALEAANIAAAFGVGSAWKAALISTGIGALAVAAGIAAAYVITHWSQVKGWFGTFWNVLKRTGAAAWAALKELARGAVYAILQYATLAIRGVLKAASYLPVVGGKAKAALRAINEFLAKWKPNFSNVTNAFAAGGHQAGVAFASQVEDAMAKAAHGVALAKRAQTGGGATKPAKPPPPAAATTATAPPKKPLGLGLGTKTTSFELPIRLQIAEAKASATQSQADDLRVAREVRAYVLRQIATGKLKGQILVGAWNALASANQTIAQASKDAADKAAAASKKQAEALKKQTDTLKQQIQAVKQTIQQRLTDARTSIGDLLSDSGPTPAQLGATGPPISVLTGNIKGQNATFAQFQKDLATIAKRSHNQALVTQLRGEGVGAASEIHTIATSSRKDLNAFLGQFAARERLVAKAANITKLTARQVNLTASLVKLQGDPGYYATSTDARDRPQTIIIELDGRQVAKVITPHQKRTPKRGSQARGRR